MGQQRWWEGEEQPEEKREGVSTDWMVLSQGVRQEVSPSSMCDGVSVEMQRCGVACGGELRLSRVTAGEQRCESSAHKWSVWCSPSPSMLCRHRLLPPHLRHIVHSPSPH